MICQIFLTYSLAIYTFTVRGKRRKKMGRKRRERKRMKEGKKEEGKEEEEENSNDSLPLLMVFNSSVHCDSLSSC